MSTVASQDFLQSGGDVGIQLREWSEPFPVQATLAFRSGDQRGFIRMSDRAPVRLDADARLGLIDRVARGDSTAFATLYDDMSPTIFGIIRRVVRDEAQSEEVLQEVMVEVWRTAARFDGAKGSVAAWMSTVAHRRAIDRVRSEQATRDRIDRDAAQRETTVASVDDHIVDALTAKADRERVQAALDTLTPVQRESLELAYWGGHTHAQVAAILDIPLGTVKTRIRDGLLRLRESLGARRG